MDKFKALFTGVIGQTALGALIGVTAYNGCVWLYNKGADMINEHKAKSYRAPV